MADQALDRPIPRSASSTPQKAGYSPAPAAAQAHGLYSLEKIDGEDNPPSPPQAL